MLRGAGGGPSASVILRPAVPIHPDDGDRLILRRWLV
jgi:hypothetical protein